MNDIEELINYNDNPELNYKYTMKDHYKRQFTLHINKL
jgi:hypothetical protein